MGTKETMLSLSQEHQANVIETLNTNTRYFEDVFIILIWSRIRPYRKDAFSNIMKISPPNNENF